MAKKSVSIDRPLRQLVAKLDKTKVPRDGDVVIRLKDAKPIRVALRSGEKSRVYRTLTKRSPRLEISGDSDRIRAILEGKKDPKEAFLEGSLTVRGDLDYLQLVLRSLGLMD